MDVRWISASGIEERAWSDVAALLERDAGFVWVDILSSSAAASEPERLRSERT